jgi:hypothetical protein
MNLHRPYSVFYRGMFMFADMTRKSAEARAFRFAKEKDWTIANIEIREICLKGVN